MTSHSSDLAREILLREAEITAAVERWAGALADAVDDVAARLAVIEDALDVAAPSDQLAVGRGRRALEGALLDLAGLAAALQLGPPTTGGYRLRALASDVQAGRR